MALTLADVKTLSQDKLTNYVIDEFRKSALLDSLPFDDTVKPQGGKTLAYVYNRVTTLPTAETRELNNEYNAQEAKTTQVTVNLGIFGGSYKIDRVLANDETQVLNEVKFQQAQKIQAARALFHDQFINGTHSGETTGFDGIDKLIKAAKGELKPDAAIDISDADKMEQNYKKFLYFFRKLRGKMDGAPTLYLCNNDMFTAFQSIADMAGIPTTTKENFGNEVMGYGNTMFMDMGDKPGTSTPIIPTTAGKTSIYAVRLGLDGVHAVSPDAKTGLIKTWLPDFTTAGAVKTGEVEMVAGVALKSTRSAAVLRDIQIAPVGGVSG